MCNLVWNNMRDFKIDLKVWFQTKIARHEVQLPLYYIYFEITKFSCSDKGFLVFTNACWSSGELICRKLQKLCFNWIGFFKQAIGCCILKSSSLADKKMRFKAKNWWDSWINRTNESKLDYKDQQCCQNGCNNVWYLAPS